MLHLQHMRWVYFRSKPFSTDPSGRAALRQRLSGPRTLHPWEPEGEARDRRSALHLLQSLPRQCWSEPPGSRTGALCVELVRFVRFIDPISTRSWLGLAIDGDGVDDETKSRCATLRADLNATSHTTGFTIRRQKRVTKQTYDRNMSDQSSKSLITCSGSSTPELKD